MTILIVPSWYKTESNPILGSFFREQALMLNATDQKVIVADATFQGRADYFSKRCFKLQKYDDDGVLTYSYVVPALGAFKSKDGGSGRYYKNLKKIYKRITADGYQIDLIHAHSYLPAGTAAVRLGKEENIPVVVTEHSSAVLEKDLTPYRVNLLKNVVRDSSTFICVSNALKKAVLELISKERELVVIPNAVSKKFSCENVEKGDKFTFISIGNLVESKRFDLTIKAFAESFAGNHKIQLKILGDGILRESLQLLAQKYNVEEQVVFEGRVSRESVIQELRNSNLFVLPSDYETFGVVYIEAMACGLPVIATKNGGAEDIVSEDTGYLIERNNMEQLAQIMQTAYEEYDAFDRIKIAEICQQRFGEKEVADKLIKLYLNCME